jgi:hypothetical protein
VRLLLTDHSASEQHRRRSRVLDCPVAGCTVALQRIPVRIQALPAPTLLDHSCAVSLTSGMPGHSLPRGLKASDRRILGGLSGHLRLSLR